MVNSHRNWNVEDVSGEVEILWKLINDKLENGE